LLDGSPTGFNWWFRQSTADWNERKAKLAEREDWIKGRERKLSRMEHAGKWG
jgi:hypothetical protein